MIHHYLFIPQKLQKVNSLSHKLKRSSRKQPAFTIVELLIVIVIIAILAAITIVSYSGITSRAKTASVEADVSNAIKKLEIAKTQDPAQQYPASLASIGVSASSGNTYTYNYQSSDNSYCVESKNETIVWHASSGSPTAQSGLCGEDSLVGWWKLNGNANDSSSNGLNGTESGAVAPAVGQNGSGGSAYLFPGTVSDYINLGSSTLLNQPELTLSAWVNSASISSVGQDIIAKELQYKYRISDFGVGLLTSSNGTAWSDTSACGYSFSANTWYLVTATLNSKVGLRKIFVNGVAVCGNSVPVGMVGYNSSPVTIGVYRSSSGATGESFNGRIDDARFYNRALTAAEIKMLYDAGAQ